MDLTNSMQYLDQSKKVIPVCSQTFSKGYHYFPEGVSPVYLRYGEGSHVRDVDDNEFVDFICGLGTITLGYNYKVVNDAIMCQLTHGIIYSLPHPLEVELSEKLIEILPCAEMVRFAKNGTDVTNAAVRLARAYTGREKIAYWGYHGGGNDWYAITTDKSSGVLNILDDYILSFEYNDIDSLRAQFDLNPDQIAAVIMEPMIVVPPLPGFLEGIKQICEQNGALLIFDEIVTGFRWSLGGAQEYFNVIPDLACFGKGMANGMPLSALVGRAEIMRLLEDVFFSYTFAGECLSLAAGLATITEMKEKDTISHCWSLGERLIKGLKSIGLQVGGFPCRPAITSEWILEPKNKSLLIQELLRHGVLVHSGFLINLCYSHSEMSIDHALNAFEDSLKDIASGKAKLEGKLIKPSFRRL